MPDDHDAAIPRSISSVPDPYGPAALLLVESLFHGLCENALLSTDGAIEITGRAARIKAIKPKKRCGRAAVAVARIIVGDRGVAEDRRRTKPDAHAIFHSVAACGVSGLCPVIALP